MYLPDVSSEEGGEEIRWERSGGGNHNYKGAAEAAEVCLRARKLAVTKPTFSSFVSLAVSTGECGCEYERRERAESRPTDPPHHARAVLCMCHVYKALGAGASASVPGETQDRYVVVLLEKKRHTHLPRVRIPGWRGGHGACPQA